MLLKLFLYVLITVYVFFAPYYLLTKRYSQAYSLGDRLLGTFILGISQIIITEVVLGFSLKLVSFNLFILNIVISTCILVFAHVGLKEVLRQLREAREGLATLFNMVFSHRVISVIFVLAVIQVCWWAFQAYLFPPYAWDSLQFHLPKVALMLQSHGIEVFKTGSVTANAYPFNIELLLLWNVIYLGNDILVNGTQIVFAVFSVLAIYGIARKVGVKRENALFAMIFLFIPIVIQQTTTCYIDIATSCILLIAVNFILLKDKPCINLVILGLATGIMIGAKYSLVLPSLVISLTLLLLIMQELRTERYVGNRQFVLFRKRLLKDLCLYIIPILLCGSIWYIRNYILYGNPIAPIEISLLGKTLFSGSMMPADFGAGAPIVTDPRSIINAWLERGNPVPQWDNAYYVYFGARGGFGPIFPILLIPSIFFSLLIAFKKRLRGYLLISLVFVLAFLLTPVNWQQRYTIFLCGFGVLSFTFVMEHLPNYKTIALVVIPLVLFSFIVGNTHVYYTPERILDFVHRPLYERQTSDFPHYFKDYEELFRKTTEKPETTVLYTDVPNGFSYPLWDSNFTNIVINIPKHYTDYEEFADFVEEFGKSLIVTTADSDITEYWNAHKPNLQLIYQKDDWLIISYIYDDNA